MNISYDSRHGFTLVASLIIACFLVYTYSGEPVVTDVSADSSFVSYSVTISNDGPTVSNVECCFRDVGGTFTDGDCHPHGGSWVPSEGTNYDVHCNFTVSDTNGWQDMTDGWVNATWHHHSVAWNSPLDRDTRYINSTCTNVSGTESGNNIVYQCYFGGVAYWADAGIWSLLVNSSDGTTIGLPHEANITIENLTTLWQQSTINFGAMGLGENGSQGNLGNAQVIAITNNTGNTIISLEVSAVDQQMNCTIGEIPLVNIKYDGDSDATMSNACGQLTSTQTWDIECSAGNDVVRISDCTDNCPGALSLGYTYWGIKIPDSSVGGTCAVQVIFTAVQG